MATDFVTADDLGLTPEEVRDLYPQAVELVGLGGEPCWSAADLELDTDRE